MVTSDPATRADYLARVGALASLVAVHGARMEREARLPDPLFAAIADAGLLRLWLPRALGGPELSPLDFMAVVEEAAALDGSVGWIIGNGAGMSRAGGYLPAAVVGSWFADPHAFIVAATGAVGRAVPADGGYRVTGRWPFGSGVHHATQAMVLCQVADDGPGQAPPRLVCCYLDIAGVEIIGGWHVSGLRGTGSCDFAVQDRFVAASQCHGFPDLEPTQPGIVYRLPVLSAFPWTVATVPLGIARGAMDAFAELAARKSRSASAVVLRDRETIQAEFGRMQACHEAARAFLADAMTGLMAAVGGDDAPLMQARARFRLACTHAADTASHIVSTLARAAGSAAILQAEQLERRLRDVQAAASHRAMAPENYILAGRVGLGLDPGTTRF